MKLSCLLDKVMVICLYLNITNLDHKSNLGMLV